MPTARLTATRTSSTGPTRLGPTTSASIRGRPSSRCSSTRPAGLPGPRASAATRPSGAAAMAIFSLLQDQNSGQLNNIDCRRRAGDEPANFAFITKSGVPHAPPAPLTQTAGTFTPSSATDLFMGSGDQLTVDIHDGAAGLVVTIHDLTTGGTGSMTASATNGFAQVNFEPTAAACSQSPYTFRPMYATSSEHTRVPWAAHSYNVAFSDEIGHFEYCSAVTGEGGDCTSNNEDSLDDDDTGCFSAAFSLFVPIGGCIASDSDFDGTSYQPVWPGTDPNRGQDKKYHPSPITFTSPLFNGSAELQPRRLRDRPASDRGAGLRRHLQPVHGRELREPAARLELLPDLHDRHLDAATRAPTGTASGSSAGRSSRARPTRSAGTRRPSTDRCCSASTRTPTRRFGSGRTTSADPELESLPGLADGRADNGERPGRGALPLTS